MRRRNRKCCWSRRRPGVGIGHDLRRLRAPPRPDWPAGTSRTGLICRCRAGTLLSPVGGWVPSIRQLETIALGPALAPRRLGRLGVALAAHAGKDDDLRADRLGPLAWLGPLDLRLRPRVRPRAEIENHCHYVPLTDSPQFGASASPIAPRAQEIVANHSI